MSARGKKSRILPVVGPVVLGLSIATILCSGSSLTQASLERNLQDVTAYITQKANAAGKDAKISYGAPSIEGWAFTKHAGVDNVAIELSDKSSLTAGNWTISTPHMNITADSSSLNGLVFAFADPITIDNAGHFKTIITPQSPVKYTYSNMQEQQKRAIVNSLKLYSPIGFNTVTSESNVTFALAFDDSPVFRIKEIPDNNERDATYDFHHVTLTSAAGTQLAAASISSHFTEAPGQDGRLNDKYTLNVSDAVLHNHDKTSKTYSLAADLTSVRDLPKADAASVLVNSETTINNAQLSSDDFTVKLTGTIATAPDDSLPFGSATVDIDHVQPFLASELLPDSARKPLASALQKITGQSGDALTHANIALKRDKGGTFYIGDMTFEALAASVLTDMMQTLPKAPALPAPAPDHAAPTPAETPAPVQ